MGRGPDAAAEPRPAHRDVAGSGQRLPPPRSGRSVEPECPLHQRRPLPIADTVLPNDVLGWHSAEWCKRAAEGVRNNYCEKRCRTAQRVAKFASRASEENGGVCDLRRGPGRRGAHVRSMRGPPSRLRRFGAQPPRVGDGKLDVVGRPNLRWSGREGWLANRSSLTNAGERRLVAQICPRWNPLTSWMRQIEDFQGAA